MNYLKHAISRWIDNNSIDELEKLPWMNERLKEEEIEFWIWRGLLDKELNRTKTLADTSAVFLDVDGVLNHSKSNDALDSQCLENLKKIIDKTKSVIILVSSWKSGWYKNDKSRQDDDANYLDTRLKEVGLSIFDKSSRYASGRLIEVVDWVMKLNCSSFVILDDDFGHYLGTPLEKHCVVTSYNDGGLTEDLTNYAISVLQNNYK